MTDCKKDPALQLRVCAGQCRIFCFFHRKMRPMKEKRAARMRTRRRGRWLLKQPRLGARMCLGTFFFCAGKTGADTPGYRCIIYWSARSDRKFSKQTPSGSGICSAFDAEIHLEIKSAAFWTETEKSTPFSASAIRIEAKISPVPCRDGPAEGVRQVR